MNQDGLFTTGGTATLLKALPEEAGRLYHLDPALGGSIESVWIITSTDTAYIRRWDGPNAPNPYIRAPYRDTNTDAGALKELGYTLIGETA